MFSHLPSLSSRTSSLPHPFHSQSTSSPEATMPKGILFTPTDDLVLTCAWRCTSQDPNTGTNQSLGFLEKSTRQLFRKFAVGLRRFHECGRGGETYHQVVEKLMAATYRKGMLPVGSCDLSCRSQIRCEKLQAIFRVLCGGCL
jgi:hypothetical protein